MTHVAAKRVTCRAEVPLLVTRNRHETNPANNLHHLSIVLTGVFRILVPTANGNCFAERDNPQAGHLVATSESHDEMLIPKKIGSEKSARERAGLLAASMGFPANRIEDIKTAVGEATLNAIEHASSQDSSDTVIVQFDSKGGELEVGVSSKGVPFIPSDIKPDIKAKIEGRDRPRGWGLFLIRALADTFEINNENEFTTVRMKFLLKNAG